MNSVIQFLSLKENSSFRTNLILGDPKKASSRALSKTQYSMIEIGINFHCLSYIVVGEHTFRDLDFASYMSKLVVFYNRSHKLIWIFWYFYIDDYPVIKNHGSYLLVRQM